MYDGEIHGCCGCSCAQSVDANVRAQKAPSANDVIGVRIAFVTDVINHPHLAKQRPEPGLLDRLDHGMTAFPRSIVKKIICPPARAVTPAFQRPQCRIEPFGNGASRACCFLAAGGPAPHLCEAHAQSRYQRRGCNCYTVERGSWAISLFAGISMPNERLREIAVYAICKKQGKKYFLLKERGKVDIRVPIPDDLSPIEALRNQSVPTDPRPLR
jgi:hypothetical protein